ncbi:hypothetical protein HN011_001277 [Eciton burchellii]|nr:hypothetical protein HN011_001277 [Eciton burchellii]
MSDDVMTTAKSFATSVHHQGETTETTEPSSNVTSMVSSESKRKKEKDKTNCHLANEKEDMLKCFFVADNVATTRPAANAGEVERTASKFNDTYPPKIFPQDKDVKSIDNADEAIRKRLKHTFYTIITPKKVTDTFSIASSGVESKDGDGKDTTATISPASKINNIGDTSFGNSSGIASQKSANNGGMSGGMIVLIAMLTFSITTAIIYAGVITYRRYLEYRWNRRQLLDNDSEFDANDLHHFELGETYKKL